MLKPKQVSKITLFGSKKYMKQVIELLYESNVLHIVDFSKKSEEENIFDIGEPFLANEKYSDVLVKLRSLISNLQITGKPAMIRDTAIDSIGKKTQLIYEKAAELFMEKEYYSSLVDVYKKKEVKKYLQNLKLDDEAKSSNLEYFIGFYNGEASKLRDELEKLSSFIKLGNSNNLKIAAVFCNQKHKNAVSQILDKYEFSPIDIPVLKEHFGKLAGTPAQKFMKLDYEGDRANKELEKINGQIKEFADENKDFLLEAEKKLSIEVEKAEAPLKFGTTNNTFLIKGFVPSKNAKKLEKELEEITDGNIAVKIEKPGKHEEVPVIYNHPKIVEPFEAFMDLYSMPSYKEIDPTFFMFLTFPIFFGMMLGDVGYGLITLGLFLYLKKKMPGAKHFLNAFIIASISSILFGAAFGEYFGVEFVPEGLGKTLGFHPETIEHGGIKEVVYPIPHIFSRSHQIDDLLSISILLGIVHILIGLIIGFINVYNNHGFKHAMYEKGGWILIMPSMVWLLLNFLSIITGFIGEIIKTVLPPVPVLGVMFIAGSILVIKGEGIRGFLEVIFLSLLSNIVSYARLMAVGLASLSLAVVVNDLASDMFSNGIVGIIGGILILIIGHTINLVLGIFSPFLHSIRLHYVEFFTKFYTGGGKKFKSFGYKHGGQ